MSKRPTTTATARPAFRRPERRPTKGIQMTVRLTQVEADTLEILAQVLNRYCAQVLRESLMEKAASMGVKVNGKGKK